MSLLSWIVCPFEAFFTAFWSPFQSLTVTVFPAAEAVNGMPAIMLITITMATSMLRKRLCFICLFLLVLIDPKCYTLGGLHAIF